MLPLLKSFLVKQNQIRKMIKQTQFELFQVLQPGTIPQVQRKDQKSENVPAV